MPDSLTLRQSKVSPTSVGVTLPCCRRGWLVGLKMTLRLPLRLSDGGSRRRQISASLASSRRGRFAKTAMTSFLPPPLSKREMPATIIARKGVALRENRSRASEIIQCRSFEDGITSFHAPPSIARAIITVILSSGISYPDSG